MFYWHCAATNILILCHPVIALWREGQLGSGKFALMALLGLCAMTLSLETFRGLWIFLALWMYEIKFSILRTVRQAL
jgi:hypothetical protein